MARFNRINLDGKSITETRTKATTTLPGTLLSIGSNDRFAVATAGASGALYVANTAHLQGLGADDTIPVGESIEGEYLETGRGVAALVASGVTVGMDTPLQVGASGQLVLATTGVVVAYAKEAYTVGDSAELVWVRGA